MDAPAAAVRRETSHAAGSCRITPQVRPLLRRRRTLAEPVKASPLVYRLPVGHLDEATRPAVSGTTRRVREATGLAVLATGGWLATVWVSAHVHPDPTLTRVALFVHLASLVAGLGAVLTVDYFAIRWLLGRCTLRQVVTVGGGASALVWIGLTGLLVSGALLTPDLSSRLTQVKLALVLLVALNGAYAGVVQHRLTAAGAHAPRSVMLQAGATAAISQAGWWGAAVVGFLNSQA
ncbi:MAG: hypothetical protein ACRDOY_07655 [Nocardioidaceae bacterium]